MHLILDHTALNFDGSLPALWRVRQHWDEQPLADLPAATMAALDRLDLALTPGARVAVTAGSRGISGLVPITRAAVAWLRARRAEPFVVPAMGSHGGATAEGQLQLLAGLGLTETSLDCPIHSSMEVVDLGLASDGTPVFMDRLAAEADGVLVINRVKAHTSFDGPLASGLAKMCAVGLGKREGAALFHRDGAAGMRKRLVPMARVVVERGRVIAGLADLVTAQLAAKVDFHATYTNALTAGVVGLPKAALPMTLPTTRAAILAAIRSCGQPDPAQVRLVRIKNTLQLEELLVSAALLPEVAAQPQLEIMGSTLWEGL